MSLLDFQECKYDRCPKEAVVVRKLEIDHKHELHEFRIPLCHDHDADECIEEIVQEAFEKQD